MSYSIRLASVRDLKRVVEISRASFTCREDKYTAQWLIDYLASNWRVMLSVYTHSERVVGFILTELYVDGREAVRCVAVEPGYRGRGIARTMVKCIGVKSSALIRVRNKASRKLFASCGYTLRGRGEKGWVYYERD